MEKLYTVAKTRPRADYDSDHELLIVKFRLKLKKVGKTTRPFRYDLNQALKLHSGSDKYIQGIIPDMTECLKNYGPGFITLYRSQ